MFCAAPEFYYTAIVLTVVCTSWTFNAILFDLLGLSLLVYWPCFSPFSRGNFPLLCTLNFFYQVPVLFWNKFYNSPLRSNLLVLFIQYIQSSVFIFLLHSVYCLPRVMSKLNSFFFFSRSYIHMYFCIWHMSLFFSLVSYTFHLFLTYLFRLGVLIYKKWIGNTVLSLGYLYCAS